MLSVSSIIIIGRSVRRARHTQNDWLEACFLPLVSRNQQVSRMSLDCYYHCASLLEVNSLESLECLHCLACIVVCWCWQLVLAPISSPRKQCQPTVGCRRKWKLNDKQVEEETDWAGWTFRLSVASCGAQRASQSALTAELPAENLLDSWRNIRDVGSASIDWFECKFATSVSCFNLNFVCLPVELCVLCMKVSCISNIMDDLNFRCESFPQQVCVT